MVNNRHDAMGKKHSLLQLKTALNSYLSKAASRTQKKSPMMRYGMAWVRDEVGLPGNEEGDATMVALNGIGTRHNT